MRAVALCSDVPALPLTEDNLAVLLARSHRRREPPRSGRGRSRRLVIDDRLRAGDDGYHIQSPEQKDWEKSRRGKEPRPADAIRIRKTLIRQALAGLSVTKGTIVQGRAMGGGREARRRRRRPASSRRPTRHAAINSATSPVKTPTKNRVSWVYSLSDDTYETHRRVVPQR